VRSLPQRSGVDFAYGGTRYDAGGQTCPEHGRRMTIYRYTGQRIETGTGLYDYGARWYDPYLNRWIQPGTIVPERGNWYA
jgi:RHS repeat-associated protein